MIELPVLSLSASLLNSADKYWVGETGEQSWEDTDNWSDTPGGVGGASLPSPGDTVHFLFDAAVELDLTIQTAVKCHFDIAATAFINLILDTTNAELSLISDISGLKNLQTGFYSKLRTNNFDITLNNSFICLALSECYLGTSTVNIGDGTNYRAYYDIADTVVMDADEATFNFYLCTSEEANFIELRAKEYGAVNIYTLGESCTLYATTCTIGSFSIQGDGAVNFSYDVSTPAITTGSFSPAGDTAGGLIIQHGTGWTITQASGTVDAINCDIRKSIATGGAIFNAFTSIGNVDGGGNTGWTFKMNNELPLLSLSTNIFTWKTRDIDATLTVPIFSIDTFIDQNVSFGSLEASIYPIDITAYGGGYFSQSIPSISLSASGDTDVIGTLSKAIPRLIINTTAHQDGVGYIALTLPAITLSANGFISPVGDMEKAIPAVRLTASAIAGIVGNLEKEIGAVILDASSYWQDENGSVLSMPALRLYAHAQSAIWEMIAINTKNNGLTNYSNYEYNSLCVMNDQVFGAKSDGIYLLEGDDDNGEDISWSLKTGKIDVENELSQRVRHIWFSRRSSGDLLLVVNDGENEYEYPVTAYSETDDAVRVKLGKGIKSKYIQLELKNIGNETLRLDSFKLFADKRPRQR